MIDKASYRGTFYVVSIDEESDPKGLWAARKDLKGFDVHRLNSGKRIEDWPNEVTFWFTKGEHAQDLMSGGAYLDLISERVRQVFEKHQIKGAQFLPVRVIHQKTGEDVGKYWALNVVQEVEALDWTHTIWTTLDTKEIEEAPSLHILKPALIWERVQGVDIFRLKIRGEGGVEVLVSARLKKYLEEAGATSGFAFLPRKAY